MGKKGSFGGTKRPWTAKDDQKVRDLNAGGMSDSSIGKAMGRHAQLVAQKRRKLGVGPVPQAYHGFERAEGNWMVVGDRGGGDTLILEQGNERRCKRLAAEYGRVLEGYQRIFAQRVRGYL